MSIDSNTVAGAAPDLSLVASDVPASRSYVLWTQSPVGRGKVGKAVCLVKGQRSTVTGKKAGRNAKNTK